MLVRDLMKAPQVCGPADTLERAAQLLWEHDCGVVPVVDGKRRVVGMLTDRDICMAAYTRGRALNELPVHSAMARAVTRCLPDQDVEAALGVMAGAQVHRLPVVDADERLIGILSVTDVVLAAQGRPSAVRNRLSGLIATSLARVCGPRGATQAKPAPKARTARSSKPAAQRARTAAR